MQRCVLVAVLVFLFCVPAFAQTVRVLKLEVEGRAALNENDWAGARDAAIASALQKAIQEAAAALLPLNAKDEKFLLAIKEIIKQQDKYISNYKILAEGRQGEAYTITMDVVVALADLQSDLAVTGFGKILGEGKTGIIVSLNVKGLKKYADYSYLKEFLKKRTKIVRAIHTQSFDWQQAHLQLEISTTAQALAEELAKTGQYALETEKIKNNQITISLLQKEGEQ